MEASFTSRLDIFGAILDTLKDLFPGCHPVVGGGALRDAFHGRPIKDVDVFFRAKDHPNGLPDYSFIKPIIPAGTCYGLRSDMHGVWDVLAPMLGYDVQIIVADFETFTDLAGTFDIGLSRITYNGSELFMHDDFIEDSRDKAFRIRRADDDGSTDRSERRISRFLTKYPDFTDESGQPQPL